MTVQQRVAKGAALLDAKLPGWRRFIHVRDLKMADLDSCILGQLGSSSMIENDWMKHPYNRAADFLFGSDGVDGSDEVELQVEHGFDDVAGREWSLLQEEWEREVAGVLV